MKKTLNKLVKFMVLLVLVTGCQDDDKTFGSLDAPVNLKLDYEIVGKAAETPNGDGTGSVILKASADNAISFKYIFPDGSTATVAGGQYNKRFTKTGINTYDVTVVAYGRGGVSSSGTFTVTDVLSNFNDPKTTTFLTNNSSKVWYWAAAEAAHLGVGPNDASDIKNNFWPFWYRAVAFEKDAAEASSCLYKNKLTFSLDGSSIKFSLENQGAVFFNKAYVGVAGGSQTEDTCLPYDATGARTVTLEPANSVVAKEHSTGVQMTLSNNGTLGYYIGTSTYEILEITDTRMLVRAVQGNDPATAWYHIFTTKDPYAAGGETFSKLVWSDEFSVDGPPDATKWNMEIGNNNGWGNAEKQYYRAENANVSGGFLKITAKKEKYSGFDYTSARMNSHNHGDFKYGKMEMKAKLPADGGTWPAFWMLGSNYTTQTWPKCGEIDIMEHVANQLNTIHWTLHYPGHSGGDADGASGKIDNVTTEFHIYSITWTKDAIEFYVDEKLKRTFKNSEAVPFNWDFFIIMNMAMGGNFGGNIDPNFNQAVMEVDYVRVYQ